MVFLDETFSGPQHHVNSSTAGVEDARHDILAPWLQQWGAYHPDKMCLGVTAGVEVRQLFMKEGYLSTAIVQTILWLLQERVPKHDFSALNRVSHNKVHISGSASSIHSPKAASPSGPMPCRTCTTNGSVGALVLMGMELKWWRGSTFLRVTIKGDRLGW